MEPLESNLIPLPEVKKTDDPNQVQSLDRKKTNDETNNLVFKRGRKGENRGKQNNYCLHAVATTFNAHTEPGHRVTDNIFIGFDAIVKNLQNPDTDIGNEGCKWQDDVLLCRL